MPSRRRTPRRGAKVSALSTRAGTTRAGTTLSRRPRTARQGLLRRMWKARSAYLFIAPFFVLFAIFGVFPIGYEFVMSLFAWSGAGTPHFVGFTNFTTLFSDDLFWQSLSNTVILWLGHIFILVALALGLALLLDAPWLRGRAIYRAIAYLPNT